MTVFELIQELVKFPPTAKVRYGMDWSDDIVIDPTWADDHWVESDCSPGEPTVVLSSSLPTAHLREPVAVS